MRKRLEFLKNRIRQAICLRLHRAHHIRTPLYKQGTYETIGEVVYCKKCLKS